MATEVRVLAFAGLRDLLGAERRLTLAPGATLADAFDALVAEVPALAGHRASTRLARNGTLAPATTPVEPGDELALLPPVGGG